MRVSFRRLRGLCLILAGVSVAVIAWGSLTPGAEMPQNLPWDKFNHFIAYAGLAALIRLGGLRALASLGLSIGCGLFIEGLQLGVPGRSGADWADALANTLGALAAVGACHWLLPRRFLVARG
ncbi:VanZ family protein [Chromohalobacter canadensis]|uniref:VanZ family protein n=1 Tax=Chromohalobacter canadensis TaxID=141389 RepID=A0A285VCA2_9GAMM|nr:VanZ family protein [Chromohalobacter canadensis]MCK0770232.1 VanZ family protein [Chromohalobacter canadensis]WQH10488.1 VanZ family protein [Chromohalobacter canadensis]SOC51719.1 VanZ like family protein [Chromohalobacter canadensis]